MISRTRISVYAIPIKSFLRKIKNRAFLGGFNICICGAEFAQSTRLAIGIGHPVRLALEHHYGQLAISILRLLQFEVFKPKVLSVVIVVRIPASSHVGGTPVEKSVHRGESGLAETAASTDSGGTMLAIQRGIPLGGGREEGPLGDLFERCSTHEHCPPRRMSRAFLRLQNKHARERRSAACIPPPIPPLRPAHNPCIKSVAPQRLLDPMRAPATVGGDHG